MTRKKGVTGFKGVTRNGKGFKAELYHHGRRIVIGTFPTALEAAIEWDKKALELCGPRADLNFGVPRDHVPRQLDLTKQNGYERN